jgi:hypothetical protein
LLLSSKAQKAVKVTENRTPEFNLRIRLTSMPSRGELDGFDLEYYHVGQVYVLPSRLASLLILSGHAERVDTKPVRADAADSGGPRVPKRK